MIADSENVNFMKFFNEIIPGMIGSNLIVAKTQNVMVLAIRGAELHIAQCFQHALVTLLFGEQTEVVISVFITINNHVFWSWC